MDFNEALLWIEAHVRAFDEGPGTIGRSEVWIIEAGRLCRRTVTNGGKPIVDDDVDKRFDPPPRKDVVL